MKDPRPTIDDPAWGLGMPSPGDDGITREKVSLFDCQECGKRFHPSISDDGQITALVCSCGADYTYLTEESSTEELLGL